MLPLPLGFQPSGDITQLMQEKQDLTQKIQTDESLRVLFIAVQTDLQEQKKILPGRLKELKATAKDDADIQHVVALSKKMRTRNKQSSLGAIRDAQSTMTGLIQKVEAQKSYEETQLEAIDQQLTKVTVQPGNVALGQPPPAAVQLAEYREQAQAKAQAQGQKRKAEEGVAVEAKHAAVGEKRDAALGEKRDAALEKAETLREIEMQQQDASRSDKQLREWRKAQQLSYYRPTKVLPRFARQVANRISGPARRALEFLIHQRTVRVGVALTVVVITNLPVFIAALSQPEARENLSQTAAAVAGAVTAAFIQAVPWLLASEASAKALSGYIAQQPPQ